MEDLIKPTATKRWSNLFKDGQSSGSPLLFNHKSMQKLRNCCQNLGLFQYLLHSLGNAKSNDHKLTLNILITRITEKIFLLYANKRQALLSHLSFDLSPKIIHKNTVKANDKTPSLLTKFQRQKPKKNSLLLIMAVYFAAVVLATELIVIVTLLNFGKYTPGFIFLFTALLLLGVVSMNVLAHQKSPCVKKRGKTKIE